MELTWIGRYRSIVAALIRHSNVTQRMLSIHRYYKKHNLSLSAQEWQVLEFLLEHPNNTACMAAIADRLGIVPSTFSKCTASLIKCGLAEKYRTADNRKNIVLRSSEKGRMFYSDNVEALVGPLFRPFFETLSQFSDEQLNTIAHAIDGLTEQINESDVIDKDRLVRIE